MAQVGYIRVSSEHQNTARQLEGIALDKIFEDKISGKNAFRAALHQCYEYLREGDVLHVHSIDRLARNLSDLQKIVTLLIEKGIEVRFHKENLIFPAKSAIQESNPVQILLFHLLGAFAEFERTILKERQREGIAIAKKRGKYLGRPMKVTPEMTTSIHKLLSDKITIPEIAKQFKISVTTVYRIRNDLTNA
jgi:DNA invertase Pin-like site-specific DNA recombinase